MKVEIFPKTFDPWRSLVDYQAQNLESGSFGATATFVGTMRDFNEGDDVTAMTLEHYPGMTEKELERIASEAVAEYDLADVYLAHRVGDIAPGDPIVLVAVWSSHRREAFVACREIMEFLKSRAPFWKKETLKGDSQSARWVEKNTAG